MKYFIELVKQYSNPELFNLTKRKEIYFYDYVNSQERLNDTSLKKRDAFDSRLNKSNIAIKEYESTKEVCGKFICKHHRIIL